ncbi:MAG: hypothetical protein JST11_12285 [Acidobacteria bacterium]|nr:hypothetical protein [Acidobacteriota bacterium]
MRKISLTYWDEDLSSTVTKSFKGVPLVGGEGVEAGMRAQDDSREWDSGGRVPDRKGANWRYTRGGATSSSRRLSVCDNFEEMRGADRTPTNVLAATATALAVPYEIDWDI